MYFWGDEKKVEKHIKTQRYNSNSNNFFSIIDTNKIKTDLESLGLEYSKNTFSLEIYYHQRHIKKDAVP